MNKYVRYIVVGTRRLAEHGYSTQLGGAKALEYAIDCANHPSMWGRVFGETKDGARELVYAHKEPTSQPN